MNYAAQPVSALRLPAPVLRRVGRLVYLAGVGALLLALPGCEGMSGVGGAAAQVRILDASPDAPAVDIYQGGGGLAYNLGLGAITSYVPVQPGPGAISVVTAGTHQQLIRAAASFARGGQYTAIVGNFSGGLRERILEDQAHATANGQVNLRFVHESTHAGAVDVYLVPTGATVSSVRPLLSNFVFSMNTGYLSVPPGTYTLVALPAGTVASSSVATAYTGAAVAHAAGSARTVVLIDATATASPALQAIFATDFDPNAAM